MGNNVILIGMPGCGKSTVGIVLAKMTKRGFIDCDINIQNITGKRIQQLIDEIGSEGFLELEEELNSQIEVGDTVISTGGSAVYGEKAMKHFKEGGTVIYIRLPYDEIISRLGDFSKRGIVFREGETFENMFEERSVLYEKYADVIIDAEGLDILHTAESCIERLGE